MQTELDKRRVAALRSGLVTRLQHAGLAQADAEGAVAEYTDRVLAADRERAKADADARYRGFEFQPLPGTRAWGLVHKECGWYTAYGDDKPTSFLGGWTHAANTHRCGPSARYVYPNTFGPELDAALRATIGHVFAAEEDDIEAWCVRCDQRATIFRAVNVGAPDDANGPRVVVAPNPCDYGLLGQSGAAADAEAGADG